MTVTEEAVAAAAKIYHDQECGDGETTETCGRWQSGDRYRSPQGVTHVSYYEGRARQVLDAAAPYMSGDSHGWD